METTNQPHLRNALTASLLLHGGLLAVILFRAGMPDAQPPKQREYIEISFARHLPAPPAPVPVEHQTPMEESATTGAQAAATPVVPAPSSPTAASTTATVAGVTDNIEATQESPSPATNTLDPARLQQSIGSLALSQRGDNLQRWMQNCRQPKPNELLPADCPTRQDNRSADRANADAAADALFDSWMRSHDRNDRISRQLIADMNALHPLLEQNGLLAELASERYYYMREQYRVLNGMEKNAGGQSRFQD